MPRPQKELRRRSPSTAFPSFKLPTPVSLLVRSPQKTERISRGTWAKRSLKGWQVHIPRSGLFSTNCMTKNSAVTLKRLALLVGVACLAGCDFMYGVRRNMKLDSLPPLDCISRVIRTTPGVATVSETHAQAGRALTLTGLQPLGDIYYFRFEGDEGSHVLGVVHFETNWRGYVEFVTSDLRINVKPPQEEIDATRPVMPKIEAGLFQQCGVLKLQSGGNEICQGVECKALPN